jgi:hypothetical protein
MKQIDTFAGQNWLVTPAARAVNETPSTNIHDQKWLLVLSGVGMVNLKGNSEAQWLKETLLITPSYRDPLRYAINTHSIPRPPGTDDLNYRVEFEVEQFSPIAALSSILNMGQSINSGFAVDFWRANHFSTGEDAFSQTPVLRTNLFNGLLVDVAVRDTDAWLYRVSYNMTLLGKIVFTKIIIS